MGRDLLQDQASREFLLAAEDHLHLPLRRLMLDGPEDALQATEHAQPAIVFHSLALWRELERRGMAPSAVAGHSLGEFAALVAAEGLTAIDALLAVQARGRAMASAAVSGTGMAAVLGLSDEAVEEACAASADGVVPANYNAPGQVVISGSDRGLQAITSRLEHAGARRIIRLSVSAAFHSPFMAAAAGRFRSAWAGIELKPLRRPQVFNADAQVHVEPAEVRELMVRQLTGPVRWTASVHRLKELGIGTFVEVGPKRTLSALVKKILPNAVVHNVEDLATLDTFIGAMHAS